MSDINKSNVSIPRLDLSGNSFILDKSKLEPVIDNPRFGVNESRSSGLTNDSYNNSRYDSMVGDGAKTGIRRTSIISGIASTVAPEYDMERSNSMMSVMTDENNENRVIIVN